MSKLTVKNAQVYQFFKGHLDDDMNSVKEVFMANQSELARRFNITTYATFNMHVRKCRDWEAKGNTINYIRMDNKEFVENGSNQNNT